MGTSFNLVLFPSVSRYSAVNKTSSLSYLSIVAAIVLITYIFHTSHLFFI